MESLQFSLTGLFMFYMIITANFFVPLLPCRTQSLIANSMLVRHGLGFLTMIFFVVLANLKDKKSFKHVIGVSAALYAWFMLSTRINETLWMFLFFLLGVYYFIYMYEQNKEKEDETEKLRLNKAKRFLFVTSILTTLVGVFLYVGEKKVEYKNKFSWITFLLGNPVCKHKSPEVGVVTAIKAAAK